MELVFVRHGESEANRLEGEKGGFFCGRLDCAMTARGRAQAESLRGNAAVAGADAVFCSPLRRTVETAAAFTSRGLILDERITERSLGDFEGRWSAELAGIDAYRKYFTQEPFTAFRNSFTVSAPNGETYADVIRRVTPFLEELRGGDYRKVVVVSHAIAIRCMIKQIRGLSEEETLRLPVRHCEPIAIDFR